MKVTIDDVDVHGKRVLVRVDFNVPMKEGRIVDDRRIRAALPTLRALRERGARIIVATHLGRPKGKVNPALTTAPLAARLGERLGTAVEQLPAVVGPEVEAAVNRLADGEVAMNTTRSKPAAPIFRTFSGMSDLPVSTSMATRSPGRSARISMAPLPWMTCSRVRL